MNMKYVFMLVMLILVGSMHDKFINYESINEENRHYELVRKYLLHDSSLARSKLPLIWIHVDKEINARWWESFGSRNTTCVNQPYQLLTIKNIVDKCGGSFNVCLIDDDTFNNIIPGWSIDMSRISAPIKDKMRELALAKLLYHYGGFLVPSSFICFRDLIGIYEAGVDNNTMFVGEFIDRNITADNYNVYPNTRMMGCKSNCEMMRKYIDYIQHLVSTDFTDASNFLGTKDKWCRLEADKDNIKIIKAERLGAIDTDKEVINLDRLIGNTYIHISPKAVGIYIPHKEMLERTAYGWFVRMSAKQVIQSNTIIGKLIAIHSQDLPCAI